MKNLLKLICVPEDCACSPRFAGEAGKGADEWSSVQPRTAQDSGFLSRILHGAGDSAPRRNPEMRYAAAARLARLSAKRVRPRSFIGNIILFVCFAVFPNVSALCQSSENPVNWQFSLKWDNVPLSEIPLPDTRIKILDGYANVSLLFANTEFSDTVLLSAEGNIEKGKIYLDEYGQEISQIGGDFVVADKKLKLNSLTGKFGNIPFNANATIDFVPPYPFDASINADSVLLEEISSLLPFLKNYGAFKSPAQMQFNIRGVLPDGPVEAVATFQEAILFSVLMRNVVISFSWLDNKIILKSFYANLDEGRISGEGEIILNNKE